MWLIAHDQISDITYYRKQSQTHDHDELKAFRADVIKSVNVPAHNNQINFRDYVQQEPYGPNVQPI